LKSHLTRLIYLNKKPVSRKRGSRVGDKKRNMATSKKRGGKTSKKTKAKAKVSKKAKPKAPQKNKTKAIKNVKKAPSKAKAKVKATVIKKAKPKSTVKNKIKTPEKIKEAIVIIPEKKIAKEAAKTARISRGGPTVSETTLDKLYIVNDSNNIITLEVNAGDKGQTSDMTITLDDKIIANEMAGDFNETALGTNKELNGKKLSIVATIADTSRETNQTSLTIHVKGGFRPETFPLSKEVSQEGDSVDYLCLIEFFRPE